MTEFREEIIGDARLILGDCREVLPTLERVDVIVTDPPYGHNNNNGDLIHKWEQALGRLRDCGSSPRPIANDGPEANDLFRAVLPEFARLLPLGGCCCCCCGGGGGPDPQFARWSLWLDEAIGFKQMVVWDKGPMGMGWHYRRSYETVLVAEKPGAACRWFDESGRIENVIRPGMLAVNKIIPGAEHHPTEKPETLKAHFIRLHSQPGDVVLDPFMGAGTTGAAAMRLGRRFIGVEIDPEFFDMARRRLERIYAQPRLFEEPRAKPKQEQLDL